MKNISVDYQDGDQKFIGQLFFDEKTHHAMPTIILFPAFEGHTKFILEYAKKLCEKGFMTFVADIYGDGRSSNVLEECIKWYMPFDKDRAHTRRRAKLAYDALLKQKNVDTKKIGAIGFCFGGTCALELMRSGADLKATVCLHSRLSKSELHTHSTHSKILIMQGYQDPQVPPTELPHFAAEMAEINVNNWIFTFFGDAKHSYSDPATGTFDAIKEKEMGRAYNQHAAEKSFRYAVDFFIESLISTS